MSLAFELDRSAAEPAEVIVSLDYSRRRPPIARGRLRRTRWWEGANMALRVAPGDQVSAEQFVVGGEHAGRGAVLDVGAGLGIAPDRAVASVVRSVGEMVAEGDVIAERRSFGGLQRRALRSPLTGRVSHISAEYGTVFIQTMAAETGIRAHLSGRVVEAADGYVMIEGSGVAVAAQTGAGPAVAGILAVATASSALPTEVEGCIVACGFALDEHTVRSLTEGGAAAIFAAGIEDEALERLGWEDLLWPSAAAGARRPAPPLTIALLGVGNAPSLPQLWECLAPLAGRWASALGAESRAAPELLVSLDDRENGGGETASNAGAIVAGARVRSLAGRAEGLVGEVQAVSGVPYQLGSEVRTDVAEVLFPYDVRLRIPLLHLARVA